jgi:hypothetical protein
MKKTWFLTRALVLTGAFSLAGAVSANANPMAVPDGVYAEGSETGEFIIVNSTGKSITSLQVFPDHEAYPGVQQGIHIQQFMLKDKETQSITVPAWLSGIESLYVVVTLGKETEPYMTKVPVRITPSSGVPVLFMYRDPRADIPERAGFFAGFGTAGAIGGFFKWVKDTKGVTGITHILKKIGGSLPGGIFVVTVIPVVLGSGAYVVTKYLLHSHELYVYQAN